MAANIDLLRLYLNDTASPNVITDEELETLYSNLDSDFYATLSEGWAIKAGKVAEWYDASLDGGSLSREQVFEHCMEMARMYGEKSGSTMKNVRLARTTLGTTSSEFS